MECKRVAHEIGNPGMMTLYPLERCNCGATGTQQRQMIGKMRNAIMTKRMTTP